MAHIHLERPHGFGLPRARELARQWAGRAQEEFGMDCSFEEGEGEDTVHFKRSGVTGTLRVNAQAFEVQARLGMMLGAFKNTIEAEIEKNLDTLLAQASQKTAPRKKG